MVFVSPVFLFLFLPVTILLYFSFDKSARNYVLLAASLFFYSWGEPEYIVLITGLTIINYFFGLFIGAGSEYTLKRKLILVLAILTNLSTLAYFKYANFFLEATNSLLGANFELKEIVLPLGISFFTFHILSYLIDLYRGRFTPQTNIVNLALYIFLFPQLVAGPIIRYSFIKNAIVSRRHSIAKFFYGARRFMIGLCKKMLIANPLGEIADNIFALSPETLSFELAWIGIICYSLQIFFDFSGYSDMAIGLARIFGFKFPENFNYPYISKSIKEFWRRWHISLSTWFRDYLYIPLGGNKVGEFRCYLNLVIVFFLCGLWHGASWNFIAWGIYHGAFLTLERLPVVSKYFEKIPVWIQRSYFLLVITFGWVLFRADTLPEAYNYWLALFNMNSNPLEISTKLEILLHDNYNILCLVAAVVFSTPIAKFIKIKNTSALVITDIVLILLFVFSLGAIASGTHNPFIYFRF